MNLKMVMASIALALFGQQSYAQVYMNAKEVTVLKGIAVEGVDTAGVHQDPTCPEVLLETTMGNIRIALYNDTPLHRDNFLKWVKCGYYNGCIFHRVIKNFMVQAGDPATRKVDPLKRRFLILLMPFLQKSAIRNITISEVSSVLHARGMRRIQSLLQLPAISILLGVGISRADK